MRIASRALVVLALLVAWITVPGALGERGTGAEQCDAKRCLVDRTDGDCPASVASACDLPASARIDCTTAVPPCPPYLANCQATTQSVGCFAGQLIPPAAAVPEVDGRDAYKTTLHPGTYRWVMLQHPDTPFDATMCVYGPNRPVASSPVNRGFEAVVVDTSQQSANGVWRILIKVGFGGCPALPSAFAADEGAPGASAGEPGPAPWRGWFPAPALACDPFCQVTVASKPNAYCFGWSLLTDP